eukprot:7986824-Alexandrium_andersonii.AAC.1
MRATGSRNYLPRLARPRPNLSCAGRRGRLQAQGARRRRQSGAASGALYSRMERGPVARQRTDASNLGRGCKQRPRT